MQPTELVACLHWSIAMMQNTHWSIATMNYTESIFGQLPE